MRIRKPKIPTIQIVLTSILGAIGGVYVWKPLYDEEFKKQEALKNPVPNDEEELVS